MKPFFFLGFFIVIFSAPLYAQVTDSNINRKDSLITLPVLDSAGTGKQTGPVMDTPAVIPATFLKNKLLNSEAEAVSLAMQLKKKKAADGFFYLVAGLVLLLAFLKFFYNRYFNNLFRVFFNTSLRQSQITDQLLQAKLPSFFFNIFFVISGGIYIYSLVKHYELIDPDNEWIFMLLSVLLLGLIYFTKYCTLKFTGWVTGLDETIDIYVFIIFLINKIIGIFLVPFLIVVTFSEAQISKIAALVSVVSIGIFLLLRFFRSYGLIQNQLKISRFHFFLYIAGVEILPLLLIYKGLMIYLTKNL